MYVRRPRKFRATKHRRDSAVHGAWFHAQRSSPSWSASKSPSWPAWSARCAAAQRRSGSGCIRSAPGRSNIPSGRLRPVRLRRSWSTSATRTSRSRRGRLAQISVAVVGGRGDFIVGPDRGARRQRHDSHHRRRQRRVVPLLRRRPQRARHGAAGHARHRRERGRYHGARFARGGVVRQSRTATSKYAIFTAR